MSENGENILKKKIQRIKIKEKRKKKKDFSSVIWKDKKIIGKKKKKFHSFLFPSCEKCYFIIFNYFSTLLQHILLS